MRWLLAGQMQSMLVLLALVTPFVLLGVLLLMDRIESRLEPGLVTADLERFLTDGKPDDIERFAAEGYSPAVERYWRR